MTVKVYTDGACSNNGKPNSKGGWGFVVVNENDEQVYEEFGGKVGATNNEMELAGFLYGLNYAIGYAMIGQEIEIYSDSAYIVNCINECWYKKWERNGFQASNGESVKNQDYWKPLIKDIEQYKDVVKVIKVKGHNGNKYNEIADKLAVKGRDSNYVNV